MSGYRKLLSVLLFLPNITLGTNTQAWAVPKFFRGQASLSCARTCG